MSFWYINVDYSKNIEKILNRLAEEERKKEIDLTHFHTMFSNTSYEDIKKEAINSISLEKPYIFKKKINSFVWIHFLVTNTNVYSVLSSNNNILHNVMISNNPF
jgi:hypothetical protein